MEMRRPHCPAKSQIPYCNILPPEFGGSRRKEAQTLFRKIQTEPPHVGCYQVQGFNARIFLGNSLSYQQSPEWWHWCRYSFHQPDSHATRILPNQNSIKRPPRRSNSLSGHAIRTCP